MGNREPRTEDQETNEHENKLRDSVDCVSPCLPLSPSPLCAGSKSVVA
jgi:hypothetical protein